MNLKVGEDAVCVITHPDGVVKEGLIYPIIGIRKCECKCCEIVVNVGATNGDDADWFDGCEKCGAKHPPMRNDGIWWVDANRFRPLDELCNISELTEILETTKPFEV